MSTNELIVPFVYAGKVYAAAIVLPIIAIVTVALRFWLRMTGKAGIGVDDWFTLAALFPVVGMGICLIYGTAKAALGYPSQPYPVPMNPPMLEELYETTPKQTIVFTMDWIIWVLMVPANGLIKLSALFLYRRIFVVNKNTPFDIVTKAMVIICSSWTIGFFVAQKFSCGRRLGHSVETVANVSRCNTNVRLDGLMVSDLVTDILVWTLPIPMVWGLNMSRYKKLSIIGVLSLAAVSLAAAVVRLIVQEQIGNGGYNAHVDIDLTLTILLYWSMLESGLALIAASLPTLHYLISQSFTRPALNGVRHLISSMRSTPKSSDTIVEGPYHKVLTARKSAPSQRAIEESYELSFSQDLRKISDAESADLQGTIPEYKELKVGIRH